MLRERLDRKEDLLRDYEKDLGKLRQAEVLLREKDLLLQDLEVNNHRFFLIFAKIKSQFQTDKRAKDDETLFLRNTITETQQSLNQEKRLNSTLKNRQSNPIVHRDDSPSKLRLPKRDLNQKITRKDYEIKTLKQELHEALDTLAEQSNKVKLLELCSKVCSRKRNIELIFKLFSRIYQMNLLISLHTIRETFSLSFFFVRVNVFS